MCLFRSARCSTTATPSGTSSTSGLSAPPSGWTTRSRQAPRSVPRPTQPAFPHSVPSNSLLGSDARPPPAVRAREGGSGGRDRAGGAPAIACLPAASPRPTPIDNDPTPLKSLRFALTHISGQPWNRRLTPRKRRPSSRRSWTRCARSASPAGPSAPRPTASRSEHPSELGGRRAGTVIRACCIINVCEEGGGQRRHHSHSSSTASLARRE